MDTENKRTRTRATKSSRGIAAKPQPAGDPDETKAAKALAKETFSFWAAAEQIVDQGWMIDVGTNWEKQVEDLPETPWKAETTAVPPEGAEMPRYASSRPGRRLVQRSIERTLLYKDKEENYVKQTQQTTEGKNRSFGELS